MVLPTIPERLLVREYLDKKRVGDEVMKEHLYGELQAFFKAIADKDAKTVEKITEGNFAKKVVAGFAKSADHKLSYAPPTNGLASVQVLDKLLIRGVGVDRSTNDTNMDYVKISNAEAHGMRQYMHKYNMGLQDYYHNRETKDTKSQLVAEGDLQKAYLTERALRERARSLDKEMGEKTFRFVLRVSLQLLDGSVGQISYDQATQEADLQRAGATESTGNHVAIFECQLKAPPMMTMLDHDIKEFLMFTTLPFRNWKLVDVDNFMKGNPPYSDFLEEVAWETEV